MLSRRSFLAALSALPVVGPMFAGKGAGTTATAPVSPIIPYTGPLAGVEIRSAAGISLDWFKVREKMAEWNATRKDPFDIYDAACAIEPYVDNPRTLAEKFNDYGLAKCVEFDAEIWR